MHLLTLTTEVTLQITSATSEVTEEVKDTKTKFKVTKKKKVVEEKKEPEQKETFKVQLKKVKKKTIHQSNVVEEFTPFEELEENIPEFPTEVIQYIEYEEEPEMVDVSTEGVWVIHIAWII